MLVHLDSGNVVECVASGQGIAGVSSAADYVGNCARQYEALGYVPVERLTEQQRKNFKPSTIHRSEPQSLPNPPPLPNRPVSRTEDRNSKLVFACGSKGMSADFATGNCISPTGNQVNPLNLYPPFQAPVLKPSSGELILRCQGRAVDFVTGRCL